MRIFDGIPETEILNTLLGDQVSDMIVETIYTFSPSAQKYVDVMVYWKRNKKHMVRVSYSNTGKCLLVVYYEKDVELVAPKAKDPMARWFACETHKVDIKDPESSQLTQELVKNWVPEHVRGA